MRKKQNVQKAKQAANKKVKGDDMDFDRDDGDLKEIEGLSKMEDKLTPSQ